jgi:hypothetical protein
MPGCGECIAKLVEDALGTTDAISNEWGVASRTDQRCEYASMIHQTS